MFYLSMIIVVLCIFLMGGAVFSFINVVASRLQTNESIVKGRSHCDICNRQLSFYEMVPVFSFLVLRGKCRKCGSKLAVRYFLTELIGGLLALYCVYIYNFNIVDIIFSFLFISVLACVFLIDMDTMTIPNSLVIALLIIAVASIFFINRVGIVSRIIGFLDVSLPLLIITMLINGAFGGGDIKLMAVTGLFLGWKLNLLALFIAIVLGGTYGIYIILSGKRKNMTHFAFGPFLAIGCVVALFWGNIIINWYLGLFF